MGGAPAAAAPAAGSTTLKIRGLPFRATNADLLAFFAGYHVDPSTIEFNTQHDGRHNGEAWVSFVSAEECARAMVEKNKQHMGNRYVELFPSDKPGAGGQVQEAYPPQQQQMMMQLPSFAMPPAVPIMAPPATIA
mmetsp:Transcript_11702/g.26257  ORF Transcript_11702/g.26257 Transcript_11702/m.26257 type:complete len:135 (-) Transcript_11702:125-529(-)